MICGICNKMKCRKQFVQEDVLLCYLCNRIYTKLLKKYLNKI